jgi:uncharacterized membrane protein YfhO
LKDFVKELLQRYPDLTFSMTESILHMRSDIDKKMFKKCVEEIKAVYREHEKSPIVPRATVVDSNDNVTTDSSTQTPSRRGLFALIAANPKYIKSESKEKRRQEKARRKEAAKSREREEKRKTEETQNTTTPK